MKIDNITEHLHMQDTDVMVFLCATKNTPDERVELYTFNGKRYRWINDGARSYWQRA